MWKKWMLESLQGMEKNNGLAGVHQTFLSYLYNHVRMLTFMTCVCCRFHANAWHHFVATAVSELSLRFGKSSSSPSAAACVPIHTIQFSLLSSSEGQMLPVEVAESSIDDPIFQESNRKVSKFIQWCNLRSIVKPFKASTQQNLILRFSKWKASKASSIELKSA